MTFQDAYKKTRVIFLGGIFSDIHSEYIINNSVGMVQNSADSLQKKLLDGFDFNLPSGITVINLPFISSYPKFFRKIYFPGEKTRFGSKSSIFGYSFVNIFGIKFLSRTLSALFALLNHARHGEVILFIYSPHLPFIISGIIIKLLNPRLNACLILPDLPDFIDGSSKFLTKIKRIESLIFYKLAKHFNAYVILTQMMAYRLGVSLKKTIIIEGIASIADHDISLVKKYKGNSNRSFLYTGYISRRYGLVDLIEAFSNIDNDKIELWLCGEGDCKELIIDASNHDPRIKYFGQVPRSKALELQKTATILINPRTSEGEFTKYSFPSKIMEYMASGRPVLMHKLDGVPDEYDSHYIAPTSIDSNSLKLCMEYALTLSDDELNEIGENAKNFVLSQKNPVIQTQKILNFVFRLKND